MSGKNKCCVWFRNGLGQEGSWNVGWMMGAASPRGGIRIEHDDYVPCRVPGWQVSWEQPEELSIPPEIPDGAQWKLFPTV